mgnify:CR=1 FL=1
MRRLQKIFAALTELAAEPTASKAIAEAWSRIQRRAVEAKPADPNMEREDRRADALVDRIIAAVVGIAEDNEKPKAAKADA